MEERKIQQAMKALGLKRQIIGVRFLVFRQDYEASKGEEMEKSTLCQLVLWAGDGKKVKAGMENLSCRNGAYAVGMCSVPEEEKSEERSLLPEIMKALLLPGRFAKISSLYLRIFMYRNCAAGKDGRGRYCNDDRHCKGYHAYYAGIRAVLWRCKKCCHSRKMRGVQ